MNKKFNRKEEILKAQKSEISYCSNLIKEKTNKRGYVVLSKKTSNEICRVLDYIAQEMSNDLGINFISLPPRYFIETKEALFASIKSLGARNSAETLFKNKQK